jgi:hypothetical protein
MRETAGVWVYFFILVLSFLVSGSGMQGLLMTVWGTWKKHVLQNMVKVWVNQAQIKVDLSLN